MHKKVWLHFPKSDHRDLQGCEAIDRKEFTSEPNALASGHAIQKPEASANGSLTRDLFPAARVVTCYVLVANAAFARSRKF